MNIAREHRVSQIQLIEDAALRLWNRVLFYWFDPLFAARGYALGLRRLGDGEKPAAVAGLVDRQRVKRLLLAAADQRRQRDVEQPLEWGANQLGRALEAELEEGVAIQGGNRPGRVHGNDALAPGPDELGPAVE